MTVTTVAENEYKIPISYSEPGAPWKLNPHGEDHETRTGKPTATKKVLVNCLNEIKTTLTAATLDHTMLQCCCYRSHT